MIIVFFDLFKDGSLGGIVVGVLFIIIDGGSDDCLKDFDIFVYVEIFYCYVINDFIVIIFGLFVIINLNYDEDNEIFWVGSLRI